MEHAKHQRLLNYLNRIISGKYSNVEILNPFYLIYDVTVTEGDNKNIIKQFLYAKPRLISEFVVATYAFGKGFYKAIRTFFSSLFYLDFKRRQLFYGSLNKNADVVVLSWLYKKDIDEFVKCRKEDSIWRDLYADFNKNGIRYQNIVIPLFKPTSAEFEYLENSGCLVLNVQMPHSWKWQLELAAIGVYTFFSRFRDIGNVFNSIIYFSSHFSERYLRSIQIYHALKNKLKNVNKKYVLLVPWEAHPEQKAIVRAFSEAGNVTFGYIHSALGNNWGYLSKIGCPLARSSYPHYLFVHGNDVVDMLACIGWERNEIIKIRSIRYVPRQIEELKGKVFLPYSSIQVSEYLDMIQHLTKRGLLAVEDIVLHPDMRIKKGLLNKVNKITRATGSESAIIVAGMSTIIFEALEIGLTVKQLINGQYGLWHEGMYPSVQRRLIDSKYYELSLDKENRGAIIDFSDRNTLATDQIFLDKLYEMRRS